jgi:hypothetical protein
MSRIISILGPLLVLLFAAQWVACDKRNTLYCDDYRVACPDGLSCNVAARRCESGLDMTMVDLAGPAEDLSGADIPPTCQGGCNGATPFCVNGACVACSTLADPEGACFAVSATAPHCATTGTHAGKCVGCRDTNDCPAVAQRLCDATTATCRGCINDAECSSKVCDLTPGSSTRGQCVDATTVVYVAPVGTCLPTNSGNSPAEALCSIETAAKKVGKTVVRIAAGAYSETIVLDNLTVTLVGEGTTAAIRTIDLNKPVIEVKNAASKIVIRNVQIYGALGNAASNGILCAAGQLSVLQTTIKTNEGMGIDANNCASLVIDRSVIGPDNKAGGLRVGNAYTITNNFIVNNGMAVNALGGVTINSSAGNRVFANNTVADNQGSGANAGVNCQMQAGNTVYNTILFGNGPTETNCLTSFTATDDAADPNKAVLLSVSNLPGFKIPGSDYHLLSTSVCRDKGSPLVPTPSYDYDGEARPDPTTTMVDIGADEVP